jgi:hypothetical protein
LTYFGEFHRHPIRLDANDPAPGRHEDHAVGTFELKDHLAMGSDGIRAVGNDEQAFEAYIPRVPGNESRIARRHFHMEFPGHPRKLAPFITIVHSLGFP